MSERSELREYIRQVPIAVKMALLLTVSYGGVYLAAGFFKEPDDVIFTTLFSGSSFAFGFMLVWYLIRMGEAKAEADRIPGGAGGTTNYMTPLNDSEVWGKYSKGLRNKRRTGLFNRWVYATTVPIISVELVTRLVKLKGDEIVGVMFLVWVVVAVVLHLPEIINRKKNRNTNVWGESLKDVALETKTVDVIYRDVLRTFVGKELYRHPGVVQGIERRLDCSLVEIEVHWDTQWGNFEEVYPNIDVREHLSDTEGIEVYTIRSEDARYVTNENGRYRTVKEYYRLNRKYHDDYTEDKYVGEELRKLGKRNLTELDKKLYNQGLTVVDIVQETEGEPEYEELYTMYVVLLEDIAEAMDASESILGEVAKEVQEQAEEIILLFIEDVQAKHKRVQEEDKKKRNLQVEVVAGGLTGGIERIKERRLRQDAMDGNLKPYNLDEDIENTVANMQGTTKRK